jgi:hypothetical protein
METRAEGTASDLREHAAQAGEAAQQKAVELKHEGGVALRSQVDERTTQLGQQARALAGSLQRAGGELEAKDGSETAGRVATAVADRIDRLGEYLQGVRGDDLVRDAERVARRRPWLVAGGAALVGFAASRLLKASAERRYDSGASGSDYEQGSWTGSTRPSDRSDRGLVEGAQVPAGSAVAPGS